MQILIDFIKNALRTLFTLLAEIGFITDEQLSKLFSWGDWIMFTKLEEIINKLFAAINEFLSKLDIRADWDKIFGDIL